MGLDGPERRLAAPAWAPLLGSLSPTAVPDDPERPRRIAYNTTFRGRPQLRVLDVARGGDRVVADGALSVAWGPAGGLAYFQGPRGKLDEPQRFRGHVVVDGRRWTRSPGRYVVAAWAGERLLAYRLRPTWPDLLVLDAPGRVRVLAGGAALVAVSPDGRRVFVSTYGAQPARVRVLDIVTGRELAARGVPEVRFLAESGSWTGRHVAVSAPGGVAIFRVLDGEIELERIVRLDLREYQGVAHEPRLDARGRVVTWAELVPRPREALGGAALLVCRRRCVRVATSSSASPPRPLYNPSRPLSSG